MIPACHSDACGQDSRKCPTPTACQVSEPSEYNELADWFRDMASAGVTILKLVAVVAVVVIFAALVGA